MRDDGPSTPKVTRTVTQARGGVTPGVVRWVLGCSLVLAIVGLIIAYLVA